MARTFGTTSDWLNLGNDTALNLPSLSMTVCAFVFPTASTLGFIIGRTGFSPSSAAGWGLKTNLTTRALRLTKYGIVDLTAVTAAPALSVWTFVAAVLSASQVRFYAQPVGGAAFAENVANASAMSANVPNAAEIGLERSGVSTINPFPGSIYGARVWIGQQLSDAQLGQLAGGASAASVQSGISGEWMMASPGASPEPDTSASGFPGTVNGTTVAADPTFPVVSAMPIVNMAQWRTDKVEP